MENTISASEWQQVKGWFGHFINQPFEKVPDLLDELTCDNRLKETLIKMLNIHNLDSELTITPKQNAAEIVAGHALKAGEQFGKYQIVKQLGSGGMGTVYLATRQEQVVQKVAIKVLHSYNLENHAKTRFDIERQVLAGLEHPNIARLIDAGIEGGRSYYAMEYVNGLDVETYCQTHQLDLNERLQIFLKICSAVSYAHNHLIIHRDIKPSNILVTADNEVKLLDFSIAKPLDTLPGFDNLYETLAANPVFTPQFAAPEQINAGPITVSCDVYSLGLLLYRLLTGAHALDLRDKPWADAVNSINNDMPRLPSKAAKTTSEESYSDWSNKLKGDLDAIICCTLNKSPKDRYSNVELMAQDIKSFICGEPIRIKHNQNFYRFKKFFYKHLITVSLLTTIFMTMLIASVWIWQQSEQIVRERDAALTEKQIAEQVTDFLVQTFKSADPKQTKGSKLSAHEIMQQGLYKLNHQNLQTPVQNKLKVVMAEVYLNLGEARQTENLLQSIDQIQDASLDFKKSLLNVDLLLDKRDMTHAEQAIAILGELENQENLEPTDFLEITHRQILAYMVLEQYEVSHEIAEATLKLAEKLYGSETLDFSHWLTKVAALNYFAHTIPITRERLEMALQIQQKHLGPNHLTVGNTKYEIAMLNVYSEAADEYSLNLGKEAYNIFEEVYGEFFPQRVALEGLFAVAYSALGDLKSAEKHYQLALDLEKNHYTNNPNKLAMINYNLSGVYLDQAEYKKAIDSYETVLAVMKVAKGEQSHRYYYMRINYIRALLGDQQGPRAVALLDDTIAVYEEKIRQSELIDADYTLARSYLYKGLWLIEQQQYCEAEDMMLKAIPQFVAVVNEDHTELLAAKAGLQQVRAMSSNHACSIPGSDN